MANNILGIIGRGIVGKATDYAFYNNAIILDPAINENTISDLLGCDIIFICVPTPKGNDEHFKDYMKELHDKEYSGVVCIRSTINPTYINKYTDTRGITLNVCHVPEFLTEREPGQKFYNHDVGKTVIENQGNYYLKLKPFLKEGNKTVYVPAVATQKPNSLSAAISYVQWFNENHRQITKYGSLLSQTKKAKKRRRERLEQQIYKKIG